ncbi:TIGR04211 family SH3 domain-containing protein [Litorilituus lipolyticus]|uniref:TIGR04211 family SH3 domain-containing protein n=1 Tax=Litorilituus lipolyticus TaxID=2491017 RepID=A0A502L8B7_9GAMM|nr:TIGR04211 family SH3 domain-containing protein [Litorilituus lipolyticus]TPH18581.1 TIGR04211 family SH3 domain-containing protein [Litorilituus lipolyticus]
MKNVVRVLACLFISLSSTMFVHAEELESAPEIQSGFISDDLTIFMHAGPGTNYRILGTITAGTQIQITGNSDKGYSEIIDDKNRTTWVESKYITDKPGLRFTVTELNNKIATNQEFSSQLDGEVNALKATIVDLETQNATLTKETAQLERTLNNTQSKLKDQDTNIKKQWFYMGAAVLGVGLLLGLILPKFFGRRRSSLDSWQ